MATINSTTLTEQKIEAAWVHALRQNTAFDTANGGSDVNPIIGDDQSITRAVPYVAVRCITVTPATKIAADTHEVASMRIVAATRKSQDTDKATINTLAGAIRAVIFSANLTGWLEEPGPTDVNVHNALYQSDQIAFEDESDANHYIKALTVQTSISLSVAS